MQETSIKGEVRFGYKTNVVKSQIAHFATHAGDPLPAKAPGDGTLLAANHLGQ